MDPNSLNARRSFGSQDQNPQVFRPINQPTLNSQPVQSVQPVQFVQTAQAFSPAPMPAPLPLPLPPSPLEAASTVAVTSTIASNPFGSYSMNTPADASRQPIAAQTPSPVAQQGLPTYSQPVNQSVNRLGEQFGYQQTNQPLNHYAQTARFGQSAQPFQQVQRPKRKKRLLTIGIASIVVVGIAAGGVFGLYLPNTSENVWKTGLNRSGETLEQLSTEATAADKIDVLTKSTLAGSVEYTSQGETFTGKINSKYDPITSDTTLSVSFKAPSFDAASQMAAPESAKQQEIGLQILTEQVADKVFPNTFFKLSGYKALGFDGFLPGLNDYDGKWIAAPADYLQSFLPADELEKLKADKKSDKSDSQFSHEDAAELARITMANSRKYIFSTDVETAILVQKSFVGTEELDGDITANHYMVSLNKTNAKKFCQSIIDDLAASEALKKLPGMDKDTFAEDKKTAIDDCKKGVDDDIDENDTFDLWIDKSYKLIHKVRLTDKEENGSYVDIGQSYTGGDVLPLFVKVHSDKDKMDGTFTLDIDMKQNTTVGAWNFKATGEEAFSTKASLEFKPHEGNVTISKPTNAVPLKDVLSRFGIDPADFAADTMPGRSGVDKDDVRIREL